MKGLFQRVAFFLLLISFIPFLFFFVRRESPPPKVRVETHRNQVVKDFSLRSSGRDFWVLVSPEALFHGEQEVFLKFPKLTLYRNNGARIVVRSSEAVYHKQKNKLYLKGVNLTGRDFKVTAPSGVFDFKSGRFFAEKGCKIVLEGSGVTTGKRCIFNLKKDSFSVSGKVKSIFRSGVR